MNKISDTKSEIRYGIFGGIATILFFSAIWLTFPRQAFAGVIYQSSFLIYMVCMYLAVKEENKLANGDLEFRTAARTGFVVFLVANIFFWLFYYMMHLLNPEIVEYQRQDMLENAKHIYPKDQLARQIRAIKEADLTLTLAGTIYGYFKGTVSAFIISMFIALVNRIQNR